MNLSLISQVLAQELPESVAQAQGLAGWMIFLFAALCALDLFIPFYLYADATKRRLSGLPWAAGSFFSLFFLAAISVISGVYLNVAAAVVFGSLAIITPFIILFVYLVMRTPAVQRVCPECGKPMQTTWRICPYCEEVKAPGPAAAPGAVFIPPPVSQQFPGTAAGMGARGGERSTLVRAREEKKTIRRRDREAGLTLGWLVVKKGPGIGKEYKITEEITTIGRETSNEIVLNDEEVSRQHARLRVEKGKFILYDLGSANGTYVNGEEIQKAVLDDGDTIRLGSTELTFKTVS